MQKTTRHSHLFVLRVWPEDLGNGKKEWRGEIEHAATREKHYFREWSVLLDFVRTSCQQAAWHAADEDDFRIRKETKREVD